MHEQCQARRTNYMGVKSSEEPSLLVGSSRTAGSLICRCLPDPLGKRDKNNNATIGGGAGVVHCHGYCIRQ
jgi:hypothetical protein